MGIELAQSRVDVAFLQAKLNVIRDTAQMALTSMPIGVEPPEGYVLLSKEALLSLQVAIS